MPVTIKKSGEAPSDQIIAAAKQSVTVTDTSGRAITVRKLTPFDRMRMSKVVGAENSANQSYMVYALVAYSLKELDGEQIVPPRTEAELEHLVQRLGEDGYQATLDAVVSFYATAADSEAALAEAKK